MKEEYKLITIILKSGLITWLLLLAVWSFGAMFYTDDFLPGPFVTLKGMAGLISDGTLEKDIMFSLIRVLKGWILGLLFAVPAGLCVGYFKPAGYVLEPFLNFFRFIPAIGFITLFLLWFGVGESSKVSLIFYAVIFPVMVNTIAGVKSVDYSLIEAAQSMGAGRSKVLYGDRTVCCAEYIYRSAPGTQRSYYLYRGRRNAGGIGRNRLSDLYIAPVL